MVVFRENEAEPISPVSMCRPGNVIVLSPSRKREHEAALTGSDRIRFGQVADRRP